MSHMHLAWSSLRLWMWMLWGSSAHMGHHTGSMPACSGSQPCSWLSQSHASSAHRSWARRRAGQQLQPDRFVKSSRCASVSSVSKLHEVWPYKVELQVLGVVALTCIGQAQSAEVVADLGSSVQDCSSLHAMRMLVVTLCVSIHSRKVYKADLNRKDNIVSLH